MVLSNQHLNTNKTMELGNQNKSDLYKTDPKVNNVINSVERVLKIPYVTMATKTRMRQVTFARQLCMYFLNEKTTLTYHQIGLLFGGRDHSTIWYALKIVNDLQIHNEYKYQFEAVKESIELGLKELDEHRFENKLKEVNGILELSKTLSPEEIAIMLINHEKNIIYEANKEKKADNSIGIN